MNRKKIVIHIQKLSVMFMLIITNIKIDHSSHFNYHFKVIRQG